MSNRKKESYVTVFRYAHENLGITHGLNCRSFMADYEVALMDAFLEVVPTAQTQHCHFHFCQANKRNAKKCSEMTNFCET